MTLEFQDFHNPGSIELDLSEESIDDITGYTRTL